MASITPLNGLSLVQILVFIIKILWAELPFRGHQSWIDDSWHRFGEATGFQFEPMIVSIVEQELHLLASGYKYIVDGSVLNA